MRSNAAEQVIDGKSKIDISSFGKEVYEVDLISSGRRVIEANASKMYNARPDRVAAAVAVQKIDR